MQPKPQRHALRHGSPLAALFTALPGLIRENNGLYAHSLKVCLLSAGAGPGCRTGQTTSGAPQNPSVQLYSRDDTVMALNLQAISQACADGWRPTRPIARGEQPSTLEPPFDVSRSTPPSKVQLEAFGEGLSQFILLQRTMVHEPFFNPDLFPYPADSGGLRLLLPKEFLALGMESLCMAHMQPAGL